MGWNSFFIGLAIGLSILALANMSPGSLNLSGSVSSDVPCKKSFQRYLEEESVKQPTSLIEYKRVESLGLCARIRLQVLAVLFCVREKRCSVAQSFQ